MIGLCMHKLAPTSVLLHLDGTNGSTTITDETGNTTWAVAGSAAISTAQSQFGGASCTFNGSNSALTTPNSSFIDLLAVTAWTIEGWIRPIDLTNRRIFSTGGGAGSFNATNGIHILVQLTSSRINLQLSNNTVSPISILGGSPVIGAWQHWAACQDSVSTRLYLNGVQVVNGTTAPSRPSGAPTANVGRIPGAGASANDYNGFQDEIRIIRGSAAYNGPTYAVPTSPFPPP